MYDRYEIRLAGTGGQGLILGGIILGEAAAIFDNKNAVQTQSYGPEARGGMSKADVIISPREINYPKVETVDALLVLSQRSAMAYTKIVKPKGILIYDMDEVQELPETGNYRPIGLPIVSTARNKLRPIVTNIVALGALRDVTDVVSRKALQKALLKRAPKGTEEINRRALQAGYDMVQEAFKSGRIKL